MRGRTIATCSGLTWAAEANASASAGLECDEPDGGHRKASTKAARMDRSSVDDETYQGSSKLAEDHFQRLARLLEMEAEAEARQARERAQRFSVAEAERTGNSLVDLVIVEEQ